MPDESASCWLFPECLLLIDLKWSSLFGCCISRYHSKPLIGSVKSNLGHLLTAAGMYTRLTVI